MTGAQRDRRRCRTATMPAPRRCRPDDGSRDEQLDARRIVLALAAPLLAIVVAFVVTCSSCSSPATRSLRCGTSSSRRRSRARSLRSSTPRRSTTCRRSPSPIGFRMNLFNIGVDGQYRVAVFAAAVFAGQAWLPGWLNIIVALVVAMVAGAASGPASPASSR